MTTFPGFHTDFDIVDYVPLIQRTLRKIAAHFYVTRSFKPKTIGNSVYYAALVRPTDEFSIYVNTDREILILFASYENFEIRTLEAYAKFYELLGSTRIDKSIRFLISADARIESIIKHYLDQNPEYPIIIPVTFNNIIQKSNNSLLDSVRRTYLLRDLFGYQNPLREETFFFGRQHLVNSVLDMAKSGQNSSLFGLRKSGKTSVIFAIQRKAKGLSINVTQIDCEDPAVHARSYGHLLSYVVSELRRTAGLKKSQIDLGDNLPLISENFRFQMNILTNASKNNFLLIFDEIENISPKTAASEHWRAGNDTIYFWQILRSYLQSESKGRVSICLVGTNPRILETSEINGISNPVYLYAQKRFIPNFEFEDTRDMVKRLGYFMGLEFSLETILDLQKEFGGHPFFIRQVCSKIHQLASINRPMAVSNAALQKAKAESAGQLESYLRDIIENLRSAYPEEYRILAAVLSGEKGEISEYGTEAPDLIDHLIGYGLVAKSGEDYDVKFSAIKKALNHVVLADTSDEDRWAELSRRRNQLESHIRMALFHWSRGVSAVDWVDIVETNLTSSRRENLQSIEPSVLFSQKSSPLYLSDVLMLIKDHRVLSFLGERRSSIVRCLDTVNRLRKDAHARSVLDAELTDARKAFDFLESEFMAP